ncbi:MATE family efflux transporter [Paenibacillus aurantius]|uniref:Probable multidrug resistance protein NorM n=1 Tax=Paenibacillus aurantius TaxID=2918900 RepID=A0AA96LEE0_9BACL|nr:MATE family efflux transporter [Paenibacillus aurantius]WNQ10097.1 MATE family efflux transporter [Paenibacillus aurantius]
MTRHWGLILRLALPSIISFATITLTGTINLILVGHMGALVIAAVGVSNIIMYNAWALCSGFGLTVNYLVAQNYGAGDMKKGVARTYLALYMCLGLGVLLHLIGWLAPASILRLMGGSPELVETGTDYLEIRFYAMAFATLSFIFHGFFRGVGDTKTPMILSIASNILMVFFTYGLTYGHWGFPELGLPGAAWGIWIGEAVGLLGSAYVFFVRLHKRFATRIRAVIDRAESRLILAESGKLGVQEFAMSLAMFVFTMFVTRLGDEALAANEVALNVMSLGFMPAFAFSATATILVGREVGRGNPLLAKRYQTDTAVLGSLFLLVLGAVEFVFAAQIAGIYTADPAVSELAEKLIRISAFLQLFDGLFNFFAGGMRGLGETSFLVKASFLLSWLVFVPLAYLLTFVWGLDSVGAWISLYTFLTAYGVTVLIRFYRTDWSQVTVKEAG